MAASETYKRPSSWPEIPPLLQASDGTCMVRYDNETGKGDHRHEGDREEPYAFTDVETLVADFLVDIARVRRGGA